MHSVEHLQTLLLWKSIHFIINSFNLFFFFSKILVILLVKFGSFSFRLTPQVCACVYAWSGLLCPHWCFPSWHSHIPVLSLSDEFYYLYCRLTVSVYCGSVSAVWLWLRHFVCLWKQRPVTVWITWWWTSLRKEICYRPSNFFQVGVTSIRKCHKLFKQSPADRFLPVLHVNSFIGVSSVNISDGVTALTSKTEKSNISKISHKCWQIWL